jgi:hypothetical protein
MGRISRVVLPVVLAGTLVFFSSLTLSPLSLVTPADGLPDRIDDVYLHFDTLRTDLADYDWPTEASRTMSSAFAEFRRTHFHSGIDISTRGRTGFKVFAARSGHVERILVSPHGYGKMLQVRHEDGFVTLYAHLDRFADPIEQYVRGFQYANEQYGLDVRPEPEVFPVIKGEVIAYTGATGVGPPHLHFEIRDERLNPANPLLFPRFAEAVEDTRAPEFHQINFAPFDFTGRINGSPLPVSLSARKQANGEYVLPRSVRLAGSIGLSVRATDRVNATWHNNGVYHYELFVDSVLVYTSRLDRFSSKQSEQIALHYDWPLVEAGEGRFQKLFLEPGNRLPLYARSPEKSGVIESGTFERGYHTLTLVARDIHGNQSRLKATVVFDETPVIEAKKDGEHIVITPQSEVHSIVMASRAPGTKSWKGTTYEASNLDTTAEGYVLPAPANKAVKLEARNTAGTPSHPVYFSPPTRSTRPTSLAVRKEFVRDYVLVTLSSHLPFTLRPSLWITHGDSRSLVEIHATDERTYAGVIPLTGLASTLVDIDARGTINGTTVQSQDAFSVFPILPGSGGSISVGEGEFLIDFDVRGVYQPLYVRIERTDEGYAAFPQDVLLNAGATVRYRRPADADDRTALFAREGREHAIFSRRVSDGFFEGKTTKFLGEYTIRRDTIPPEISRVSVRASRKKLAVRFGLRDYLSGVDPDKVRVTVDDRFVLAVLDPDRKEVVVDELIELAPGNSVITIECRDKMGNAAVVTRRVMVK